MARPKLVRPLGDVLLDLEPLINEMCVEHGLQFGDVLALVLSHMEVHNPAAKEVYTADGSSPVYYYGPRKETSDDN